MAYIFNKIINARVLNTQCKNAQFCVRHFAEKQSDKPITTKISTKEIVVKGSEETDRLRVRRARPADAPRVLKFVNAHASSLWPGVESKTNSVSNLILSDYVSRALAQGHSMLAEQLETRKGWSYIRGVAIALSTAPWDASLLMKWSKCVACDKSKKLMHFTAHCLQTPDLHQKYNLQKLMQVTLIVPENHPKANEIATKLVKSTLERGQEIGAPLMRFDVTNSATGKMLENMKLTKEWEMTFNNRDYGASGSEILMPEPPHYVAVYSIAPKTAGGNTDINLSAITNTESKQPSK